MDTPNRFTVIYPLLYRASFAAIIITIPFAIKLSYVFIGIATFLWVLRLRHNVSSFDRELLIPFVVFVSLYILQLAGLVHTDNISSGLNKIESKLSLLLFPVLVFAGPLTRRDIFILKWLFVIAVTAACLYCHVVVIGKALEGNGALDVFKNPAYKYIWFTEALKIHPTYLTLFAAFSFFLLLSLTHNFNQRSQYLIVGIAFVYYSLVIYQAVSRGGIVAFIIALLIVAFYEIYSARKYGWIAVILLAIVLFVTGTFISDFWRTKFLDDFHQLSAMSLTDNDSSVGQHIKSWKCAIDLFLTDHFLFGYGTGDEKDVLGQCYQDHHWILMTELKNDAHNEYLSSAIRHGVIGVSVLLFFFGFVLREAWARRDMTYVSFLVMFIVICLFESSLKARVSLVYFCAFNTLLYKDTPS